MSKIVSGSWVDLGYAVLGRASDPLTQHKAALLAKRAGYELNVDRNLVWAKLSGVSQFVRLHGPITRSDYTEPKFNEMFSWFGSTREEQQRLVSMTDQALGFAAEQLMQEDGHMMFYRVRQLLSLLKPSQLGDALRELVAPTFFRRYPEGRIWFISVHEKVATLEAANRALAQIDSFGLDTFSDEGRNAKAPVMGHGHPGLHLGLTASLSTLCTLFYPQVYAFLVARPDSYLLFQLDKPLQIEPKFPWDVYDLLRQHSLFKENRTDGVADFIQNKLDDTKLVHGRYNHERKWTVQDFESLLRWWIAGYNNFLTQSLNLTNFRDEKDNSIQSVRAFKSGLTWERIQYLTMLIQTERDRFERKSLVFQVIDQFSSLISDEKNRKVTEAMVRESMLRKSFFETTITSILKNLPSPFNTYFAEFGSLVYADIAAQSLLGLRNQSRVKPDSVSLSTWDETRKAFQNVDIPKEDYVANFHQAFRNSLHGYNLKYRQFERYFLTHTGNTSDYLPELAVLYLVAGLQNPEGIIQRNWVKSPTTT